MSGIMCRIPKRLFKLMEEEKIRYENEMGLNLKNVKAFEVLCNKIEKFNDDHNIKRFLNEYQ